MPPKSKHSKSSAQNWRKDSTPSFEHSHNVKKARTKSFAENHEVSSIPFPTSLAHTTHDLSINSNCSGFLPPPDCREAEPTSGSSSQIPKPTDKPTAFESADSNSQTTRQI